MKVKGKLFRYIQDYKFNSLFFRNLLLLLVLIMVPLTGTVIISYYSYSNMQKEEIRTYSEKITSDIYSKLERILKESRTELMYFGLNSNVELYMYDEQLNQYNYKISTIQELIKMPVLAKDYVESIYIYSARSNKVISLQGVADYQNFQERDCIERYLNQKDDNKVLFVTESGSGGYLKKRLSIYQDVTYGHETKGVSIMNLDMDSLLEELDIPENVQAYLTDGETILLSSDQEMTGRPVQDLEWYDRLVHGGTLMGHNYSITSKCAVASDLEVIMRMGMDGYHDQLNTIRTFILTFLVIMVAITLGLSAVISVRLFGPIEQIITSIRKYHSVLIGEEELFQERDELEYILSSIQKTVNVKKDVDDELAERVRLLKKAQAVALQSQINPHFLNNTLETINWTAIELLGGRNEISGMAGALSKMLRMTLENTDTIVPVSAEIQHCRYYLEIQEKRYEDKFEVVWEVPEEVNQCRIIRIVLQPLVENAIYHGIKPLSNKGIITISGSLRGDLVELTVSDNGLGMTAEELKQLQNSMRSDMIKESSHIGVTNVNQRIRLYFGEQYGVFIDSREGIGTQVSVRFPKIMT